MKRNRRTHPHFISPFLALFTVMCLALAGFPADVLASTIYITIKNDSDHALDFAAFDGNDKLCSSPKKKLTVRKDSEEKIHCDGGGKGYCRMAGRTTSTHKDVWILGKPTTFSDSGDIGCSNMKSVPRNTVLTCYTESVYECY